MTNINELLQAIAETYVEFIKAELIRYGLKDSNIINNIDYTISNETIDIQMPDYWRYIEDGRKPGKQPPVSALIRWIKRKRINTSNVNSLAWAIAKNIAKNGIRPRPFFSKGIERGNKEASDLLSINVDTILNEKIKEMIDG